MQRIGTWLAIVTAALIALLAARNWSTLALPTDVDLLVTQVRAPLGLLMLALTAALFTVFLLTSLRSLIGSLMESRSLLKEVQRLQTLADQAEASRIQSLQQLIATEFQQVNERLNRLSPVSGQVLARLT